MIASKAKKKGPSKAFLDDEGPIQSKQHTAATISALAPKRPLAGTTAEPPEEDRPTPSPPSQPAPKKNKIIKKLVPKGTKAKQAAEQAAGSPEGEELPSKRLKADEGDGE
eukprot:323749_1